MCTSFARRGWLALAGVLVVFTTIACSGSSGGLDRASDDVKQLVSSIEAAEPPTSYTFSYSIISTVFMACLSGVEDVDGVVDASNRVVRLTPHVRGGDVYFQDGVLFIDDALLAGSDPSTNFVSIALGSDPDAETLNAIKDALGVGLSGLISGGEWSAHPNEIVQAALPVAVSITPIAPNEAALEGIRIVLDPGAYFALVEQDPISDDAHPPVIDAYVSADGVVQQLVIRIADEANPAVPAANGDGYTMQYLFDASIQISPPDQSQIVTMDAADLPNESVAIPCQVEP